MAVRLGCVQSYPPRNRYGKHLFCILSCHLICGYGKKMGTNSADNSICYVDDRRIQCEQNFLVKNKSVKPAFILH